MKVAVIINTHNEGSDIGRTVESFRSAKGEGVYLRFFLVADGTTDGSCDPLGESPDVVVLKPNERLGCGQAKHLAVTMAQRDFDPDVIFHSDGHNRMIRGSLALVAEHCLRSEPCIVTPAVGPLNCANAKTCKDHASKACTVECPRIRDAEEPPRNSYHGGRISCKKDGEEVGLFADNTIAWPKEQVFETQVVNPSCFAYSKKTLDHIGGINRYPGWWGSQELGFSLRAWYTATPIICLRADLCCVLHRYRSWNHPEGRALAPYHIPNVHRDVNQRYCNRMVFSDETWADVWKPWFDRFHPSAEADEMLASCEWLDEQRREFELRKKRTDHQFFAEVLQMPFPQEEVHPDARRGLYCISAGLGNALLCIPAIKALSRATGEPVDVWDRGLHQAEGVAELLAMQPFVRKVIPKGESPDLRYYRCIVGSYWARGPMFPHKGATVREAERGWRTKHEAECNLEAVEGLYSGPVPGAEIQAWKRADFQLPEDYVAVGVGCAGYTSKKWPHWEAFAKEMHGKGVPLVFLGTAKEDEPWMDVYGVNLCGKTTIAQAAGVLELARLYVGLDNGLSHLAAAVHCRSLLLYGPSSERKNRPWTDRCRVLRSGVHKCAPCWDRPSASRCQFAAEDRRPCMEAIRPEWVAGEALKELAAPAWTHGDSWSLYLSRKQAMTNIDAEPLQNHQEFAQLVELLREEQVVNVMEIGVARGGWIGTLATCVGRSLNVLTVDPFDPEERQFPSGIPNCKERYLEVWKTLAGAGHCMEHVHRSSRDPLTIQSVQKFVSKHGLLDLLHIDGDHSMQGCLADYEAFKEFVRPGGFIVFHDTSNPEEPGVRAVFEAIAGDKGEAFQTWEFRCQDGAPKGRGVGVVRKQLADAAA